jgi:hypothetical protein
MATLGVSFISPSYAETLEFAIKLYVCVFLVWRFHPFRTRPHFTELDYKISFNAGMIILMTTILNAYLKMEPVLPAELQKKRVGREETDANAYANEFEETIDLLGEI